MISLASADIQRFRLVSLPCREATNVPSVIDTLDNLMEIASARRQKLTKSVAIKVLSVSDSGVRPHCPLCMKMCQLGDADNVVCKTCGELEAEPQFKYAMKCEITGMNGKDVCICTSKVMRK